MIPIKTDQEIEIMRQAGRILSGVMKKIALMVSHGDSTLDLDKAAEKLIIEAGAQPAFKGYGSGRNAYPATLCISVNNEVVHGIPRQNKKLQQGDIVGLDCGVKYKGYFSDMAVTVPVGKISPEAQRLINVTKNSLDLAIRTIKPNIYLGDISYEIQNYIEKNKFSVVRQFCGHGIGRELHEEPPVLNFGKKGTGPKLLPGMVLAFEPMVNQGRYEVEVSGDGWTVVTKDGSLSAHFEHTTLVTKRGCEVLTR